MKRYYIESTHDVYKDSYNEGETEYVTYYHQKGIVQAKDVKDAIKQYFDKELYYNFNIDNSVTDDNEVLYYSVLIDEESYEATAKDVEQWKEGKKVLYSNNIALSLFELVGVKIDA